MLEELLEKYDLFHSSIICGGKLKFNINYILGDKVYITLAALINNNEKKESYDFINDDNFNKFIIPKILERFISKNIDITMRRIMGNNNFGTLVVERRDQKDSLVIRNCSIEVMDFAEYFLKSLLDVNEDKGQYAIIISEDSHSDFENYIKYNILFDYAKYKTEYAKFDEEDSLLLLNIARYAYTFESIDCSNVWQEIENTYRDNQKVIEVCESFIKNGFNDKNKYVDALVIAEYEKNNDMLFHNSEKALQEAIRACENSVSFFDDSYLNYWIEKARYYNSILDGEHQAICLEFIDAHSIGEEIPVTELKNRIDINLKPELGKSSIIGKFKEIKNQKNAFASIINDPISKEEIENTNVEAVTDKQDDVINKLTELRESVSNKPNDDIEEEIDKIFINFDKDEFVQAAKEQAMQIIEMEKEREQLQKDADEFAKAILKSEKEHQKIVEAAQEQARRIIELEKENEELRMLAEDNAKFLFERNKKLAEEEELREYMNNSPVQAHDIDKINALLNSISNVKDLDFCVNHPTVMQELTMLEEKIVTYLKTHNNIVHDENRIVPIEKEEMIETKPVIELLSMIRNTYVSSHYYEKVGRHTLIYITPVDDDTYRVTLYSVKDDEDDELMDAFFEEYQLTDSVLSELCDIFKDGAVIVASKIDNVPPDKADYLVIDNMENAIKFMGCKKDLIEKVKAYL